MYGTMSMEVWKQRREEMLREAELGRLRRVLRADRGRPAAIRWAPTATWELARAAGLFRKFLRAPNDAG